MNTPNRPTPKGVDAIRSLDYLINCHHCKNPITVGDLLDVNHKIRFRRWITCEHCKAINVITGIRADQEKQY